MQGSLDLFLGTMFSGKTKRAMQSIQPLIESGKDYVLFQSSWNKRDGNVWRSRGLDYTLPAKVIDLTNPHFLNEMDFFARKKEVIGIDEPFSFVYGRPQDYEKKAEIYANLLAELVLGWKDSGKSIFIPSIHAFFNKKPVHFVSEIYGHADRVEFCVESTCSKCQRPASLTQRTYTGQPSKYNEPLLVLDGEKGWEYFPVCADHFEE
jgi:thymidine kinase